MGASRWALPPAAMLLMIVAHAAWPQRAGPLALLAAVGPVASALVVVLLLPLAVVRRDALLATVVVAASVAATLAYHGPGAPPSEAVGGERLTVLTWNLHGAPPDEVGLGAALKRRQPDLVVLQEAGIADDAAPAVLPGMEVLTFPEAATPPGMVLASRLPILDRGELDRPVAAWDRPRAFWLRIDTGAGVVTLLGVHLSVPFPLSSLPCPYCPDLRDAQVAAVAEFASQRSAAGEWVVVAGDFNIAEREVAYRDLSALTDAGRGLTLAALPAPMASAAAAAGLRLPGSRARSRLERDRLQVVGQRPLPAAGRAASAPVRDRHAERMVSITDADDGRDAVTGAAPFLLRDARKWTGF